VDYQSKFSLMTVLEGMFFPILCISQPINNTAFRIGHQAVTLNPYAAAIHPLLQFVHSHFHVASPFD
jgi:hypothetical protein